MTNGNECIYTGNFAAANSCVLGVRQIAMDLFIVPTIAMVHSGIVVHIVDRAIQCLEDRIVFVMCSTLRMDTCRWFSYCSSVFTVRVRVQFIQL